ncbi:MAG: TetR/AcrR family transcriptional regulator [Candidatus Heimdallarchaeota archaeon]|nr:TetR/AcrR family transcriptional regulator [Candidatus Heimdallarchaeota archaeon]
MRPKDQTKYNAIINTSLELVKELGFTGISISKIAKQANISPATIYIHFKNKEDLFTKLYTKIRTDMSRGALEGIREEMDIEHIFKSIWINAFSYNLNHLDYLIYREKFEQTSMMENIKPEDFELYNYINNLFQRGIEEHHIKDLPLPLLTSFAFVPIITLLNYHFNGVINMDENYITQACEMAWNTIKLSNF